MSLPSLSRLEVFQYLGIATSDNILTYETWIQCTRYRYLPVAWSGWVLCPSIGVSDEPFATSEHYHCPCAVWADWERSPHATSGDFALTPFNKFSSPKINLFWIKSFLPASGNTLLFPLHSTVVFQSQQQKLLQRSNLQWFYCDYLAQGPHFFLLSKSPIGDLQTPGLEATYR